MRPNPRRSARSWRVCRARAVSYTHLDVYKRQGLQCYNQMLIDALQGTGIKVLGAGGLSGVTPLDTKLYMAQACVERGCGEIESFLNVSYLKSGMYDEIVKETRAIREIAKDQVYKVILETPLLNDEEIARCV